MLNPSRHEIFNKSLFWRIVTKLTGYKPKYGFRYPPRVLAGIFVTMTLLWDEINIILWSTVSGLRGLIFYAQDFVDGARDIAEMLKAYNVLPPDSFLLDLDIMAEFIQDTMYILYGCFISALVISILNCFLGVLYHARVFRFQSRRIRRGFRQDIPTDTINAFSSITASMKYSAYICAYPIWGLVLQGWDF